MSTKENILLVANWESNVGYAWWLMENFWLTISTHFSKYDKSCYLIYPKITQLPDSIASSTISVSECDFNNHSFENLRHIRHLIKDNAIKHIYLSDSPFYSFFYVLLRLWGVKTIVVHDHSPGERTKPPYWLKLIKNLIFHIPLFTADHFIAVTEFVHKRHLEVNCIPKTKCSVANNGIFPINLENIDYNYAHNQFNIPKNKDIIITTGRASYYKGIDFYIQCANELVNNQGYRNLHFIFCGDGPDIEKFKNLYTKYRLEDHFTFAGKRSDVRQILPSCKVGFHAASGEVGYSLSILEYMSAGLVTVVPDNPSTSLSIDNMQNGVLYKPRDVQAATEAIKQALDKDFLNVTRLNAINTVENRFHINNTNAQLINTLGSVFNS